MPSLTDRSAVITGAAGGIGGATAVAMARAGASLLLVDRDAELLSRHAEAVREVAVSGASIDTHVADVSREDDVKAYVAAAINRFGRIDVFFNNAGIEGAVARIIDYPVEDFDRVISINLRGVFLGLKYVLAHMVERGSGSIINTGSIASERGLAASAGYIAAKHAVLGMTKAAAVEYAASGVRINAVLPGMIDTQLFRRICTVLADGDTEAGVTGAAAAAPINRTGSPEEIAAVVVFLAGDGASFVNGAGWPVDGGVLASVSNGG